jgi:hypothetical protein
MAQHESHRALTSTPEERAMPVTRGEEQRPDRQREWTRFPLLAAVPNRTGERGLAAVRPLGIAATEVAVIAADGPDARRRVLYPVRPEGALIEAATPKTGNYHWLQARAESAEEILVASSVWYFPNPGKAPTEMLLAPKSELEIIPVPLPREHSGYRESEKWQFLVRFHGRPLANQPLTLETEFGSRSTFLTDANGYATVLFPRDFRQAPAPGGGEAGHGPRRAGFVLATEKTAHGKRFLTAFNYTYSQDADRNRSLAWGMVFSLVGMMAAIPLLRRPSADKTREEGTDLA